MSQASSPPAAVRPSLGTVAREWTRIGSIGFAATGAHRQWVVLGAGAIALLAGRLGVVWTLLGGGVAGGAIALAGAPLP